jgi:hypothetical protein
MVAAFADLGALRAHALDTVLRTVEEVLTETQHGLESGRFRLAAPTR